MAFAYDNTFHDDLDLSDYSTSTNTSDNGHLAGSWNDWSPVVDWEAFSSSHGDFPDLIDSIMDDGNPYPTRPDVQEESNCNSASSSETMTAPQTPAKEDEAFKGLKLYHLLTAAADAVYGEHKSRHLAHVILVRLKELVSPTDGTNLERLTAYYTEALLGFLECTAGAGAGAKAHLLHQDDHSPTDVLTAFQILQEMSPYVKFGHFTANQAILEAVTGDRRVHIVDYDIMEGIQWASLIQAFVSRKDGPPATHLRITAVSRGGTGRRSIATVHETGRRLAAFAASVGQPFSFHHCKLDSHETFRPSGLKLVRGEALVFNCMLHLPHFSNRSRESIASFLSGAKNLNPRLVTLAEEEFGHGPIRDVDYKTQFLDSLERFSAIYDSLEAGFPMKNRARALVERVFLGPRISATVVGIGQRRTAEENWSWAERMENMGFREVGISFANQCQARLLVGLFNGYRAEEVSENKLVLGWKSKRLLSASIWASSSSSSSDSG